MDQRALILCLLLAAAVVVATAVAVWLRPIERIPGMALPDREVLCKDRKGRCTLTLLARLEAAPFPYKPATDENFWAGTDKKGRPYRQFRDRRYARKPHFVDDRVLIHVTPKRPSGGATIVLLYLHGHNADLRRDVIGRRKLIDQVNASGRNVILIAPQMAWRAIDSHPGKLGTRGGGARLVIAALRTLRVPGDGPALPASTATPLKQPVIVAAYSGGWRAAMWVAMRGELGAKLRGVILLDAWFGPVERWAAWKSGDGKKAFLLSLAGPRTAAAGLRVEGAMLRGGATVSKRMPKVLTDQAVLLEVLTSHARLPVDGPPDAPIAQALARISAERAKAASETPDPARLQ